VRCRSPERGVLARGLTPPDSFSQKCPAVRETPACLHRFLEASLRMLSPSRTDSEPPLTSDADPPDPLNVLVVGIIELR
jgi:hypothetical protein